MLFCARLIYSTATIYMLLILLRWLASFLQWDMGSPLGRLIARITDPLMRFVRRTLPVMGPFDFAPLASIFLVWIVRELLSTIFIQAANR